MAGDGDPAPQLPVSDTVAHCVGMMSAMKQRSAQALVLYGMDLDDRFGDFPIERAKARS